MSNTEIKQQQDVEPEPQKEYPPTKILLPAMAAIWLAVFLVALVMGPSNYCHTN